MVKKFQFEDELTDEVVENESVDKGNIINEVVDEDSSNINDESIIVEEDIMAKKKKKLKPWVIALLGLILAGMIFVLYLFTLTNNDGPVYGNRCEGVTAINIDAKNNTISLMKDKYEEITDFTIEVTCRQIRFDITFVDKMSTDKGIKIAEEAVKTLDEEVGLAKDDGKKYSQLFGYLKNEPQYDCQLTLISKDSKDYTIYGTKHHGIDEFSYTYSSVKDEESKNKAEDTLKKE